MGWHRIAQFALVAATAAATLSAFSTPVAAARSASHWTSLTGAARTACGVKTTHTAWCWGRNDQGQIGDGTRKDRHSPVRIKGHWKAVTLGTEFPGGETTCGVRTDDTGWCWGWNKFGQVGDGSTKDRSTPQRLKGRWTSFAMGGDSTCGIKTNSTGWCWGRNGLGQLGDGTRTDRHRPVQLPGRWTRLTAHADTTCGIQTDGTGWCWGSNSNGQVGDGTTDARRTSPVQLAGTWSRLTPHALGACGVQTDGSGWCWGFNDNGEVGDGTRDERRSPTRVPGTWKSITPDQVSCGVRTNDTGWCWGNGVTSPDKVAGHWLRLSSHLLTTCGIKTDHTGFCWGRNDRGQVGDGTTKDRSAPQRLKGRWRSLDGVAALLTGGIRTDGTGRMWGFNTNGQVGDGSIKDRHTPYRLS